MVDRASIVIPISIVVLLYDDGLVTIPVVAVSNQIAIAIAMVRPDGHANRPNPDPDFFRSGRHCAANAGHGNDDDCYTANHSVLLVIVLWMSNRMRSKSFRPSTAFTE
jgi:hypothetical protein